MKLLLLDIDWSFFGKEYLGEKVSNYLWFAIIILATLLLKRPVAALLTRISSALTARYSYIEHKEAVRDILFKPMDRLVQVVLYYVALNQLDGLMDQLKFHHSLSKTGRLNYTLSDVVDHVFLLIFIIFFTKAISKVIDFVYYIRMGLAQNEKNQSRVQLLPLVKEMSKLILWIISCFWIMGSVFNVNIPALITGLGIGGVAIALAGKETVENFFAAFTILSDKPFQTGDTIKLGDIEAVVERIGFRSTRLRNLDGSAYIIPNTKLVNQNLINLSVRNRRGVTVTANVRYGITYENLEKLTKDLKAELLALPMVKEPVSISVGGFDKETFQIVTSYDLPHPLPDSSKLTDITTAINLKVFEMINSTGVLGTPVGTS